MVIKNCFLFKNFDYTNKTKRLVYDEGAEKQGGQSDTPPPEPVPTKETKEIIPEAPKNNIPLDQAPDDANEEESDDSSDDSTAGVESDDAESQDEDSDTSDDQKPSTDRAKDQKENSGSSPESEKENNKKLEPTIPPEQGEAPDIDDIMQEVKKLPPPEQIKKLAEITEKEIAAGHLEKIEWKDVPVGPITTSDGRKVMAVVQVASHALTFKDKNGKRLLVPGNGNTAGKMANLLNVALPTDKLVDATVAEAKRNNAIVNFKAIPTLATTVNPQTGKVMEVIDPKTGFPIKPDWRTEYGTPHAKVMQSAAALEASTNASFAGIDKAEGKLVAGDGKSIILDADQKSDLEVIYGGINKFGRRVQGKNGTSDDRTKNQHELSYADYSHRIRPVHRQVKLFEIDDKGEAKFMGTMDYYAVLQDKEYSKLLSHRPFNADGKYGIKVTTTANSSGMLSTPHGAPSTSSDYSVHSATDNDNEYKLPSNIKIPSSGGSFSDDSKDLPQTAFIAPQEPENQQDSVYPMGAGARATSSSRRINSPDSKNTNYGSAPSTYPSTNATQTPQNYNNTAPDNEYGNKPHVETSNEGKEIYHVGVPTLLLGDSCTENVNSVFTDKDKITSIAKQSQGSGWLLKEVKTFAASPEGREKLKESIKNVFILIGVNDIAGSVEKIFENIKEICKILKEVNPQLNIMVATIPPFKKWKSFGSNYPTYEQHRQELNAMINNPNQWLDSNRPTKIIDFATLMADPNNPDSLNPEYNKGFQDGLHPDKEIMAKFIAEGFNTLSNTESVTTSTNAQHNNNDTKHNDTNSNFENNQPVTNTSETDNHPEKKEKVSLPADFKEHPEFASEQYLNYKYGPENDPLSISIDTPKPLDPNKPVKIVFYANPNGSTNAETNGYKAKGKPGYQHFLAQIRALRAKRPDEQIVAVTMSAKGLSFPAWRKRHRDHSDIFNNLIGDVKNKVNSPQARLSLLSHSGGGGVSLSLIKDHPEILQQVDEIAWLDAHYGYKVGTAETPTTKLIAWLKSNPKARLVISAYDDRSILGRKIPTKGKNGQIVMAEVKDYNYDRTLAIINEFEKNGVHLEKKDHDGYVEWSNGQISIKILHNPSGAILHTEIPRRNGIMDAIEPGNYNQPIVYQQYIQQNPTA